MMELMIARLNARSRRHGGRPTLLACALAGALLLTSCGGSSEPAAEAALTSTTAAPTTSSTTTTVAPSTTTTTTVAPSTTTTSPATTTSSTTSSTTSTTGVLTTLALEHGDDQPDEPIAPPADAYAQEPIIEMGSIKIPKLGVDMTMYEGIRLTTLDYGPGHWPGTAEPGENGNVVVGGHRTSKHRVFRNVDQLAPGDEIIFDDADGEHVYHVNRVEIVEPTAIWIVDPTDTPTATLFACHPPGSTAQRIVVFADLADG